MTEGSVELVMSVTVGAAAATTVVLARWRDLSPVAVAVAACALLWGLPWGWASLGWVVAALTLAVRVIRGPVRGQLLLGTVAAGLVVHLAVGGARLAGIDPAMARAGGASVLAVVSLAVFALATARPALRPRVRWVGEIEVEGR